MGKKQNQIFGGMCKGTGLRSSAPPLLRLSNTHSHIITLKKYVPSELRQRHETRIYYNSVHNSKTLL
jgi:hypothetical protein